MRKQKLSLVLALLLMIGGGVLADTSPGQLDETKWHGQNEAVQDNKSESRKVYSVIDGDTIRVKIDGKVEPVRLIGVDTPELSGPHTEAECFGAEASARTRELLSGKQVRLKPDNALNDRDTYDRLLRYVYLEDTSINQLLIEEGYGFEYTFKKPYAYQNEFRRAHRQASEAGRGLWAPDTCDGQTEEIDPNIDRNQSTGAVTPAEGCILYTQAPDHINEHVCVTGIVDHVFTSRSNTTFINFCRDYRECAFSAIVFEDDKHKFPDVHDLDGKKVTLEGRLQTYEGRPQIILKQKVQIRDQLNR